MKKLGIVAIALMVGASMAYASSVGIPWFMDNAAAASGVPQANGGSTTLVTLKSNETTPLTCYIAYYNADGDLLGPFEPDNSFTIAPLSALAFRPVLYDPDATVPGGINGGQEGAQGVLVPDRPRSVDATTPIPGTGGVIDTKKNGSCVITWFGGNDKSIQGQLANFSTQIQPNGDKVTMSYGHLLPPGL